MAQRLPERAETAVLIDQRNDFGAEEEQVVEWAHRRRKQGPPTCPKCGSSDVRALILGLPVPWVKKALAEGPIEIGGCMVGYPGGDPEWACGNCGFWIRKDGSGFGGRE